MGRPRKYNLNQEYFNSIDTKEKAYVIGFIFADGSVNNNYLTITIHPDDISVLEFIKKELKYSGPIHIKNNYVNLTICSKQIVKDLITVGIYPNKTYVSSSLPIINNEFFSSFLLGFFDGDGSIYSNKNKTDYCVNFSNNKQILDILKLRLETLSISSCSIRSRYKDNYISCMLDIKGSKNVEKICKLLYENPPKFFLSRKYLRFQTFNTHIKNLSRRNISDNIINRIKELYLKDIKQSIIAEKLYLPKSSVRCVIQRLRKQTII